METDGTYYKSITEFKKNEKQIGYVPSNNYAKKTDIGYAIGTSVFKDEQVALNNTSRGFYYTLPYRILVDEIPVDSFYLDASKMIVQQNDYIKKCLLDNYTIQILFHGEMEQLMTRIEQYKDEQENFDAFCKNEINYFYETKKALLLNITSCKELLEFIKEQTEEKSIEKACALLSWAGIYGIIGITNVEWDILIFDFAMHAFAIDMRSYETRELSSLTNF